MWERSSFAQQPKADGAVDRPESAIGPVEHRPLLPRVGQTVAGRLLPALAESTRSISLVGRMGLSGITNAASIPVV
jgi:hypothetical protein